MYSIFEEEEEISSLQDIIGGRREIYIPYSTSSLHKGGGGRGICILLLPHACSKNICIIIIHVIVTIEKFVYLEKPLPKNK